METEIKQAVSGTNKKVILMNPDYYAMLDGKQALKHLQSVLN